MEEIRINLTNALTRQYSFRRAGKNGQFIEIGVPRDVLEREARRKGMSLDQFLKVYSGQWFFNEFEGLLLRPNKRNKKRGNTR